MFSCVVIASPSSPKPFFSDLSAVGQRHLKEMVINVSSKRNHLVWGGGGRGGGGGGLGIEDTTYLMNITNKILWALKFELTQKFSASKSQHC